MVLGTLTKGLGRAPMRLEGELVIFLEGSFENVPISF